MKKSGRFTMWGFGVLALGIAVYLFQGIAWEQYYLSKLQSDDEEERVAAAVYLTEIGSKRLLGHADEAPPDVSDLRFVRGNDPRQHHEPDVLALLPTRIQAQFRPLSSPVFP